MAARVRPTARSGSATWSGTPGTSGCPTVASTCRSRAGGEVVGHFVLVPEPGVPVGRDALLVAVSMADQVGAAVAASGHPSSVG